ncbi:MAG TPA: DUF1573 domain-containing protein [Chitinophagaceae bacterium]|nr:DUF1573 domain-containing protein [Chitinophagaceae bacterium]
MKKSVFILALLVLALGAGAQTDNQPAAGNQDVLELKETEFDFAKIPQGKPVYHNFEIVNTGTTPLALDKVQASCGCTTPEWDHQPIAPGATAKIRVGYNAAAEGVFEKYITIMYNGNQSKQLIIKGMVWKAPPGSAPSNAAIQFLKQQIQ